MLNYQRLYPQIHWFKSLLYNPHWKSIHIFYGGSHTIFRHTHTHRIHGAAIYGNMDPINIPQMLAYIPYMDPMGHERTLSRFGNFSWCLALSISYVTYLGEWWWMIIVPEIKLSPYHCPPPVWSQWCGNSMNFPNKPWFLGLLKKLGGRDFAPYSTLLPSGNLT